MQVQYLIDEKGNKNGVLLPISEWKKIQRDMEDYERLKEKKAFFEGLTDSLTEVKMITEGRKKSNSFDDFINSL
jgi:hypothetical protein